MRKPVEGGSSVRAHLEIAAERGSALAIAKLEGPPFPEALSVLWERFQTLHQMRGEGLSGLAPLTPTDIWAANRLFDWRLRPHEVEALHLLDLVVRYPEEGY